MTTGLHQLVRTGKRPYRRVGRGQSSTRGKQSGRGGKGQTARSGHKIRPAMRDIIKKIPKRRGYGKNRGRTYVPHPEAVAISIEKLANLFESGAEVSMKSFIERGIVSGRKQQQVKIVGGGELSKKFSLKGIATTASARAAIEKAGGVILDVISEADAQAARTKTNKTTRAAEKAAAKKE